ncbi:MAG: chemotaxis protein CheW [Pedobacter sp.]|nr:chemotaxis protein CheW [Pedobacter sp.]
MSDNSLYCTFFIGEQFYGIPVGDVQEVLQSQPLTRAPLAPAAIAGLMNLRGQIVTAVDVRRVLRSQAASHTEEKMNLVIRHASTEVSLLVDQIGDVVTVDESKVERPPETLQGMAREFIRGISALEGRLLLLVDVHRMLDDDSCVRAAVAAE